MPHERTTQLHTVLLCLHVADPATYLASNSVLGTLFSSGNSLFNYVWKKYICLSLYYHLSYVVNIGIQSLNFISKTTQCHFNVTEPLNVFVIPTVLFLK